jgi:hypothetical protein
MGKAESRIVGGIYMLGFCILLPVSIDGSLMASLLSGGMFGRAAAAWWFKI